jgi:hypothetical protein
MPTETNFAMLVGLLSGGLTLSGAQDAMEKSAALDAPAEQTAQ